jgi:hypothetical protein
MAGKHGERCTCDSCIVERASDPAFRASLAYKEAVRLERSGTEWVLWDGDIRIAHGRLTAITHQMEVEPETIEKLIRTINGMRAGRGGY